MNKGDLSSEPAKPDATADAKTEASAPAAGPQEFRLLKWNELVSRGDFVANEHEEFVPWEGPPGFRADSFVKAIYRKLERRSTGTRKAA